MRRPTIEWQVQGACNYDCSYCIQRRATRVGQPDATVLDGLLRFFASLGRRFEIKMSGGEPFAHPAFLTRIVPGLIGETPHRLSVLTNLSAAPEHLERFATLTRGRLDIVSVSLHLEFAEPGAFIARAVALRAQLDPAARLVVNAVLVPGRLAALLPVAEAVAAAGLPFFPQVMKVKGGIAAYGAAELPLLTRLVGDAPTPRQANLAPSYRGRLCHAGIDYLVLTQIGDAYRCRTARRHGEGWLGNVLGSGLRWPTDPLACPYDICPCTVPANRGMIAGIGEGAAVVPAAAPVGTHPAAGEAAPGAEVMP